jgi:NAD-dependent DNA ligase
VAADPNSGSSKLKKAAKQGTVILSEEQLLELLGQ